MQTLPGHYDNVTVDEYVVMPNHVHAIVMIDGEHCFSLKAHVGMPLVSISGTVAPPKASSLSAIIRSYKAGVTRRCFELGVKQAIWQPRFHDHLLRGDKVIEAVREYIRSNPANWIADKENPFPAAPRL